MNRWFTALSVLATVSLAAGLALLDLQPLNNFPEQRELFDGPNRQRLLMAVSVLALIATLIRSRPALVVSSLIFIGAFAAQLWIWWLPYLFGPTPWHSDFSWYFRGGFLDTLHLLPERLDRPVPNAAHLLLQLLTLLSSYWLIRLTWSVHKRHKVKPRVLR
ncbi:MAG: hypothetical protein NXH85_06675 [Pseudomonadaceae bacterium]|nr:hypothetical protein [Pseudomonadaceae bacterium]